jgi:uncharacterized protein
MVLALHPREDLAKDATVSPAGSGFSGITISYNAKSEKEVDDVLKKVETTGATIIKPAQKVYGCGYSRYFKNPDEPLFEVAYKPFRELDENENINCLNKCLN